MFKKNYIFSLSVVIIWLLLWGTSFAWDIVPWVKENQINWFSQRWLFLVWWNANNSIATFKLIPNIEKPYWWKLDNTWSVDGIIKNSRFLDIGVNFDIDTRKVVMIWMWGKLVKSNFDKARKIDLELTDIANPELIENLIWYNDWNNVGNTVWFRCWTDTDENGDVVCAWLYNSVWYFKVPSYAIENRTNWIKIVSYLKKNWFIWWTYNKTNYIEYGIMKQRNFANNWDYYVLVKTIPKDNRYISSVPLSTYWIVDIFFNFNGAWMIQVWDGTDGKVAYFGTNKVGLTKITLDRFGKTTINELLNWAVDGYVSAYPKQSLWSKQVIENWETKTKRYITLILPNWTLANLDYTNAKKINLDGSYPLLTASNKWIEIEPNVENTVKAMNMLSVLQQIWEWMISNDNARYIFAKPFAILDPKFKTVTDFQGKDINYIYDFGIRNLNNDPDLHLIFDTNSIIQTSQANIVYWAIKKDYKNIYRVWYFKVAPIWYKLGQYVDNGQIISVQLDWTWALERVYSPLYTTRTNIKIEDWMKWIIQNLANNYIITHWTLSKYQLVWSFDNKTLQVNDIYTNTLVKNTIVDDFHYLVNQEDWRFNRYDETDVRYINLQWTTTTPDVLSWKDLTYITPTDTNWWDLMIASLSGDKVYLNTYIPDTAQLSTWWAQLTSWSNSLNFFKTDGNTTILIDADNLLWKKTN